MALRRLPSHIKDVNLFLDGYGLFGTVESMTLPAVKTKKEEQNGQHIDTGLLEPMEFEADVNILNQTIYAAMVMGQRAAIKAKGAYQEDGVSKSMAATMVGPVDIDPDAWKRGEVMKTKIKMYVNMYHLDLGGIPVIAVDLANSIAIVDGKDLYADVKAALL